MPMQSWNLNMNACYMTRRMHCINLNLSCQVWTLGKLLHDEPFYMPWAKQGTTDSCKSHVHHYLDKVRQAPSMYIWNASIWQGNYMTLEASNTLSSLRNLQKVLHLEVLWRYPPIDLRNEHHKVICHSLPRDLLESDGEYLCALCESVEPGC